VDRPGETLAVDKAPLDGSPALGVDPRGDHQQDGDRDRPDPHRRILLGIDRAPIVNASSERTART
jgi:hypothetical protein